MGVWGCAGPEARRRVPRLPWRAPPLRSHVGGQDPFLRTREKPTVSFVHSWGAGVLSVFRALTLVWPLGDKGEQDRQNSKQKQKTGYLRKGKEEPKSGRWTGEGWWSGGGAWSEVPLRWPLRV